jgi:hypothetical protein
MRRLLAVFLLLTCASGAGGCAQSGYDARKLERRLQDAGLEADQAACVTDGLESDLVVRDLGSHTAPSAQEIAKTRAIVDRCTATPPPRR